MSTIDSQWVLLSATVLGGAGTWLLMPPATIGRRTAGVALTAAALGLWASQLPRLDHWLGDGLLFLLAAVAVAAALVAITLPRSKHYLWAFALTGLGTAGLMLLAGAYLPALTVAAVHAGLIPAGLWLLLRRAGRSGAAGSGRPSREPLLCAAAGMVTVGVLCGVFAAVFSGAAPEYGTALLHNSVAVGAVLLGVGLIGLLGRRDAVVKLLGGQIMCQGALLSLAAFGRFHDDAAAGTLAVWIAVAAVCQAAAGAIVILAPPARSGLASVAGRWFWSAIAVAGLILAAVADGLVPLLLGVELVSLSTCAVLYCGRRDAASPDAATKYFFPGLLASAVLSFGLVLLYGSTGSTDLATIRATLADANSPGANLFPLVTTAVVLIVVGLGLRIAAVPLHFYMPDVHCRTTHAAATVAAVVLKAAALVALARILSAAASQSQPLVWQIVLVAALLTMTVANVSALRQDNLRRLLVHASIAQGGFMLLALSTITSPDAAPKAVAAMLIYLGTYAAAMVGTFATLIYLGRRGREVEIVEELAGLGRSRPLPAAALALFSASLAGIPPAAGFWGKWAVLRGTLDLGLEGGADLRPWFLAAAILGGVNVVIALVYQFRIVAVMYLRMPLGVPKAEGGRIPAATAAVCAAAIVLIGLYPDPLVKACGRAAEHIAGPAVPQPQNTGQEPAR